MPEQNATTANEYVRVSKYKGRERSPRDQHNDHVQTVEDRGWVLARTYRDTGSASRHQRKARGDFDKLLTDLEEDRFDAEILMLWASSRGSRKESEWVRLVELAELRGVQFWIETHHRLYDPANARDRRSLLEDAIDAAYDVAKLSENTRRGTASAAAEGLPHGRIPYGYTRIYNEKTRKLVAQVPHPEESKVVKELFDRILQRHPLAAITRDFEKRGIQKRSGGAFTPSHLRSLLINPTYAGIRVHDTERGKHGHRIYDGATQTKAVWDPLVEKADWLRVQRILNEPERRSHTGPRPGAAKHFLSMIARCGGCGDFVVVRKTKSGHGYACRSSAGCTVVDKAELDDLAERYILAWLADPAQYSALGEADEAQGTELARVQLDLEQARAELLDLARRVGAGQLGVEFAAMSEPGIRERINALEAREKTLSVPSTLTGLIEPGADVATRWIGVPITTRREIARRLLVPELLGELRVLPVGRVGRRKVPVQDRIIFRKPSRDVVPVENPVVFHLPEQAEVEKRAQVEVDGTARDDRR